MRCGLFGKLQSKRDFIALATPRAFLSVWEPWIQSAIASSRQSLGAGWQSAYLTAPIWRFWLGADICGATMLGATMASMDGVGRYFPLTVMAAAQDEQPLPPPEFDPQDEWFASAERFLLMTLDEGVEFLEVERALHGLPSPCGARLAPDNSARPLPQGASLAPATVEPFAAAFAKARAAGYDRIYAATSCWWTVGGEGYERMALMALRMPDPFLYSGMLTGRFEEASPIWS